MTRIVRLRWRGLLTVVLLALGAWLVVGPFAVFSRAAGCDETWASTSTSGSWTTAANWSPASVPTNGTNVCLPSGSYTVTLTGSQQANSINIGSGAALTVAISGGNAATLALSSGGNSSNSGTIELTNADSSGSASTAARVLLDSGATLTNTGTIESDAPGFGARFIDGQSATSTLDNASGGTITVNQDLQIDSTQNGLFETSGNVTIASGEKLLVDPSGGAVGGSPPADSAEMDIDGGTITDNGTFEQGISETGSHASAALKVNGGTVTGAGLIGVVGATSDIAGTGVGASFSGAGSGTYTFTGGSCACSTTVSGTIGANQTVVMSASTANGGASIETAASNVTNDGTIELTDSDTSGTNTNAAQILIGSGQTLTNDGTIVSDAGPTGQGQRIINGLSSTGTLDNAVGGTITVDQDLQIDSAQNGLFETSGNITIASGEKLLVDPSGGFIGGNPAVNSAEMDIDGGTITDNGTFEQGIGEAGGHASAALKVNGGTITGAGLVGVVGAYTDIAGSGVGASFSGSGSGTYTFTGGSCACSTTVSGTIGANQTVVMSASTANGGAVLQVNSNVTNDGTLELTDSDTSGTNTSAAEVSIDTGDSLTNHGTITSSGAHGQRMIVGQSASGTLVNASDGSVDIATATTLGANTTNNGTWTMEPGVQLQTGSSTFTQGSGGTLVTWVDPSTSSAGEITGGTTDLAGTLEVKTLGSVTPSSQFTVVSGTVSGTFGSDQFVGPTYTVATTTSSVKLTDVNDTLAVGTTSLPNGDVGQAYSQTLEPSGGTASYTWSITTGSLPSGLTLDTSTGEISGTPTGPAGTSSFTVEVTDGNMNTATQALSITIDAFGLSVTTASLPQGQVGVGYDQTLAASNGTTPYSWSVSSGSLPSGLTLNTSTGEISGTPTGPSEVSSFTVEVTDSSSPAQHAFRLLSITIAGTPLQITTTSLPDGQIGSAYDQTLGASGGTTPYSWSLSSGSLPAGLTLNTSTGEISGTPTGSPGTSSFTVEVIDSSTPTQQTTQPLSITTGPSTLQVTTSSLPAGQVGLAYNQTLAASGGTSPYTWSITSGSLPPGLSLNTSTGAITGTATGPAGTANFTVQATDSGSPAQHASAPLSITVNASTLAITTSSLGNGSLGVAYSQTLQSSGGISPYTWSIASGSLPAGLALNSSSGVISGTPTGPAATSSFTVKATDSGSPAQAVTKGLSITITAPALHVTTTLLPAGQVGSAYNQSLVATGGSPPYGWSVASGSLPAGLTLNASTGAITGTPSGPVGVASFTVGVIDSSSPTLGATQSLSISITQPYSSFSSVWCTSSSNCMAVGSFIDVSGSRALIEQWDGSNWTVLPAPIPSGSVFNSLNGVWCQSSTACIAVGSSNEGPLAERWNGTSWSVLSTPNPSGALSSGLSGVSCTAMNSCMAVGQYFTSSAIDPLAERWNGSGWSIVATRDPSPTSAMLNSVSCKASNACTAVGYAYPPSAAAVPMAQSWNGSTWSLQTLPASITAANLGGVSCSATTACTATGVNNTGGNSTLALRFNGGSWAVQATQNQSPTDALGGVSCPSASACTAAGSYLPSGGHGFLALAEGWNGSSWSTQLPPRPAGAIASFLNGVSCTSSSSCTAVGGYDTSTGLPVALAERWNGTSWSVMAIPPLIASVAISSGGGAVVTGVASSPGQFIVTVTTTGSGPVAGVRALAARAKRLLVARVRVRARRAGIVRIKIVPDRKALAFLRKHSKLAVLITVVFEPKHGKRLTTKLHTTLVLKKHDRKKR